MPKRSALEPRIFPYIWDFPARLAMPWLALADGVKAVVARTGT